MRAAATIESNADLNKAYQDKMTSIIELKISYLMRLEIGPFLRACLGAELT